MRIARGSGRSGFIGGSQLRLQLGVLLAQLRGFLFGHCGLLWWWWVAGGGLAFGEGRQRGGRGAVAGDFFLCGQLQLAHVVVGQHLVGFFQAELADDPVAQLSEQVGLRHGRPVAEGHALGKADAVGVGLGKLGRFQALHAGRLRAQHADVAQVPGARHRVVGSVGAVELGADGAPAARAHFFGEGGVYLGGQRVQAALIGLQRLGPALGRRVDGGMPLDDGGLVNLGVVGSGRGGNVRLAEFDGLAGHGDVAAGLEDVKRLGGGGCLLHTRHGRRAWPGGPTKTF